MLYSAITMVDMSPFVAFFVSGGFCPVAAETTARLYSLNSLASRNRPMAMYMAAKFSFVLARARSVLISREFFSPALTFYALSK
jgi:hypothetical protein